MLIKTELPQNMFHDQQRKTRICYVVNLKDCRNITKGFNMKLEWI